MLLKALLSLLNIPIQIVNLHGYSDSRAHADAVQHSTKCCYGALGREWVKYLSENKELVIDAIRTAISQWQNRLPAGASDQVRRVASRFAILEAALITATQFTGWGVNESKDAVTHCFDQWVALFGMENKEQRTIIEQAIAFLSVHGRSRYSSIVKGCDVPCDPDQSPIRELAGYRLLDNKQTGQQIYYTFPHVFEKEVSKGFNPKMVAQTLSDIGILEKEKGKRGGFKKKGPRLDGVQQRFYVLKLIDEENIDPEDDI